MADGRRWRHRVTSLQVLSIGGALWKTLKLITPSVMNGISPNFYGMLVWWGYTIYHIIFWFDQFFCPIGGAFWKRVLSPLLDVAGALTWAKLQLSLWNFSIMLPITRARMGLLFGAFRCTVCHIGGALWKTQKLWLLPQWWTEFHHIFMVCLSGEDTWYNIIYWFDKFFCPIGGTFWKRV
jgi:hypothetical protein